MSKSDVERQSSQPQPQPQPQPRQRTGPRQFLREVRGEMKRVAWPSRKEVASYSVVVLVTVSILIAFVFLLDSVFGRFVLWIFG